MKKSDDNVATILLGLKNTFEEEEDCSFLISKNSTIKSQLSAKILTTGFMEN